MNPAIAIGRESLDEILVRARACRLCAPHLPSAPRPVLRAEAGAKLLIIGQAPGTRVHASGIPWNDPSGDRLRQWMEMESGEFYDQSLVAIVPMGFCYPGRAAAGGDLPPRPECAPAWHPLLLAALPRVRLTLLVGAYAHARYLPGRKRTVAERVRAFREALPAYFPLPHPSWRATNWLRRNPWFEAEVLPALRAQVRGVLAG